MNNEDVASLVSLSLMVNFVTSTCLDMYRCVTESILFLITTAGSFILCESMWV